MVAPDNGVAASALRVEQLADQLSLAAQTLHAAVMRAIARRASDGANAISQQQAQAVFALEVALRQQANELYADAAGYRLGGLEPQQRQLQELFEAVRRNMARHDDVRRWINLAVSLLNLGSAVLARSPERILSTFARVRERLAELD